MSLLVSNSEKESNRESSSKELVSSTDASPHKVSPAPPSPPTLVSESATRVATFDLPSEMAPGETAVNAAVSEPPVPKTAIPVNVALWPVLWWKGETTW